MTIKPGAIRFNTDSMKLEIFRGSANYEGTASMAGIGTLAAGQWEEIQATSPDVQTGGTRGVFGGGEVPGGNSDVIDFINVSTTGNATDFGNLQQTKGILAGLADRTRACFGGGRTPSNLDQIDFVTIASTGNAADFGDLTTARLGPGGASNSTRGLFISGQTPTTLNNIDYITIQSTGNAVDFGDTQTKGVTHACASPTRAVCVINTDTIEYVEISTLGNSSNFGDMHSRAGMCSNSIRGVCGGGFPGPLDTIEYITIATLGDGTDFGDLTQARQEMNAVSSPTRGVWGGGQTPTRVNTVDYVKIMSLGDALDFGDLTVARSNSGGASNGHGGL